MRESRLGLKALIDAAGKYECPFCGDPKQKREEVKRAAPRARNEYGLLDIANEGRIGLSQQGGKGRRAYGAPEGYNLTCGEPECATAYVRYWKIDANARNRTRRAQMSVTSGTPSP